MSREEIIKILETIAKSGYISLEDLNGWKSKIDFVSDEDLPKMLKQYSIKDHRSLFRFAVGEKAKLNDICYCMLRPTSVDLHFIPKDISSEILSTEGRKKLETGFHDAMKNLYFLLSREENRDIQSITAVSNLIKPFVAKWFGVYGFDTIVERSEKIKDNKDSRLYPYYERFKEQGSIGLATVSTDKFKTTIQGYIDEIEEVKTASRQ